MIVIVFAWSKILCLTLPSLPDWGRYKSIVSSRYMLLESEEIADGNILSPTICRTVIFHFKKQWLAGNSEVLDMVPDAFPIIMAFEEYALCMT